MELRDDHHRVLSSGGSWVLVNLFVSGERFWYLDSFLFAKSHLSRGPTP